MPHTVWSCPRCRGPNGSHRTTCALCGTPAPADPVESVATTASPEPMPPPAPPASEPEVPAAPGDEVAASDPEAAEEPERAEPPIGGRPSPTPFELDAAPGPSAPRPSGAAGARGARRRPEAGAPPPSTPLVPEDAMRCATCSGAIVARRTGSARTFDCAACGGRWVDASQMRAVLGTLPPPLAPSERVQLRARWPWSPVEPPQPARQECPRCRVAMRRRAATPAGPVWIEACPLGHGFWFGRGDLERLVEFASEGGLSLPPPPHAKPIRFATDR